MKERYNENQSSDDTTEQEDGEKYGQYWKGGTPARERGEL